MSQGRGDRLMGQLPADNLGEGYQVLPNIDKERYTPIQGMEGPFMTVSGKALYYDPQEGSIHIDNQNIKDISLKSLRQNLS